MAVGFFDVLRTTLRDDSPEEIAKRKDPIQRSIAKRQVEKRLGVSNTPITAPPSRQTTFTNEDVPTEQLQARGLRGLAGRETNPYAANFVDRLARFRQVNPEFTPRSQRPGLGYTSNEGSFRARIQAREARMRQNEAQDQLGYEIRRGAPRAKILGAQAILDSVQESNTAAAEQAAGLRAAMNRNATTRRGQDLTRATALRGQNITAANNAADNYTAAQRLGLEAARFGQTKLNQDRTFKNQNAETVSKLTDAMLDREYGPSVVDGEVNTARQRASQFYTLSNAKSADDLAYVDQLYKAAKPLEEAGNISASFWPWLASKASWFRANNYSFQSADDVINAIEKYNNRDTRGEPDPLDATGQYHLDPNDLSIIQQQRIRTLSDKLRNR